jgi:hypothetical protein
MNTDQVDEEVMVVTSVRLPAATIAELERYAPDHRNGRSTLIRRGIDMMLDELRRERATGERPSRS